MITGELKSKVDRIWDTMWSGGISNPLSVIEQLTYLLFIKRLDELHTLKENNAARTRKPIEEPVFTADQEGLRWSRFKEAAPEQMFETVQNEVFPFIKTLGSKGEHDGEGGSTYTHRGGPARRGGRDRLRRVSVRVVRVVCATSSPSLAFRTRSPDGASWTSRCESGDIARTDERYCSAPAIAARQRGGLDHMLA